MSPPAEQDRDPFAYAPVPGWRANGHAMTVLTWARRRRFPGLPAPEPRLFQVAPDTRVLAQCHWHPDRRARGTLLLLHGLEGSSDAHYIRGMAEKAWRRGFNVVRLNQRNCGGTEHLGPTLYHSGLTADPLHVLRELAEADGLPALGVAGYSLGGNLALKLAGELGDAAPTWLRCVCAVSPTLDLEACVRALERRSNLAYQWNFVRNLKARMRRKAALFPERFDAGPLRRIRTVRQFDETYTAPHFGFASASDYYHRASAVRVAAQIRVPTLIVAAADDPFVPVAPFRDPAVTGNASITVRLFARGGHCAFLSPSAGEHDGYWAEVAVVRFAEAALRDAGRAAPEATRPPELRT